MSHRLKYFLFVLVLVLATPPAANAQTGRKFPHAVLGLNLGYFQPLGAWNDHRYARNIELFNGGALFDAELELRFRQVGLALCGGYSALHTGAWQNYAAARGDKVEASASFTQLGGLFRIYLHEREADAFSFDFGMNYAMPTGQEKIATGVYDYDFLKSRLGFTAGVGYHRRLSSTVALAFRIGGMFVPGGVAYAGGEKHDLNGLAITVGIRFDGSNPAAGRKIDDEIFSAAIVEARREVHADTAQIRADTSSHSIGLTVHADTTMSDSLAQISQATLTRADDEAETAGSSARFLFFAFNDDQLDLRSLQVQAELENLFNKFQQQPVRRIEIKGFADNLGDAMYNLRLSERRAQEVKDELVRRGVPAEQIFCFGLGANQPLQSNDTPAGRMMNRRVEVNLIYSN